MARLFDNNTSNYMGRSSVNLGLNGLTECSVGLWVKLTATTGDNQRFADKKYSTSDAGCPFRLQYTDSSGEVVGSVNNGAGQSPDWGFTWSPGYGVWGRVLFTFKRNAITTADGIFYLNGIAQSTSSFTANGYASGFTLAEDSNDLFYGLRVVTNLLPFYGSLAWVCVWNRQLTAQEALIDYTNPRNVKNGLVSIVELAPDADQGAIGGSMTVNGTLQPVGGPSVASANAVILDTLRPRPFCPGLAR